VAGCDESAVDEVLREQTHHHDRELSRIDFMRSYAESGACRRHSLLEYFGEESTDICGRCDNCETGRAQLLTSKARASHAAPPSPARSVVNLANAQRPFTVGSWVKHVTWGKGVVVACDHEKVTIRFAEHGEKQLSTPIVLERSLLAAEGSKRT
jgi:ATP-dependent DNA helicase RecQ